MLSVRAVYDGKSLSFRESIKVDSPHEVIVTFIDEPLEEITSFAVQEMAAQSGAFTFLDNVEEDVYTDDDLKIKY